MTSFRLPGYYRALRRWYDAEPKSRAERFWMRMRTVLSLGAVRTSSNLGSKGDR